MEISEIRAAIDDVTGRVAALENIDLSMQSLWDPIHI